MQSKEAMQSFVIDLLKKNIPAAYSYHNYEHTLYVQEKAKELGLQEKLSEEEMHLLDAAALWHDTGYLDVYKGHEEKSCQLAREYLPGYGYSKNEIDIICGLIMATKIPQTAHTLSQKILADADLAYLGTTDAAAIADNLFKELQSTNPALNRQTWHEQQIHFISYHQYFTDYYREHVEPVKQAYLQQLKEQ